MNGYDPKTHWKAKREKRKGMSKGDKCLKEPTLSKLISDIYQNIRVLDFVSDV